MQKISLDLMKDLPTLHSSDPVLVGIDGCGGAGKSTVARTLAAELGNSQIVHIDDFYKPRERRVEITEQTPVHANFEFDRLKQEVLEPLKHGAKVSCVSSTGREIKVNPHGYIIVEGLGALGQELRSYFDFKIWVEADESIRRERGIRRDTKEWTDIWDNEYLPQDARYVREQEPQKFADEVLSNN